ncbi:hypothetical protein GQ54DRAFT_6385 [Martensiomyces pterosporus]|nr:hypothetical protein GQ54DRAFT_6385 [Martensiomyces pterosporus]
MHRGRKMSFNYLARPPYLSDAATTEEAIKTAERLARLRDVLTPSYMKPAEATNGGAGAQKPQDPNAADSLESLLLNLANNELQVQQQKIQAQMPRKPTRMKLLYEDHTQPGSTGRSTSSLNSHGEQPQKQHQQLRSSQSQLRVSKPENVARQPDQPLSQTGLWPATRSNTQLSTTRSVGQTYNDSFASSIESMREATLRSEDAAKNRSSSSMLFGPRGMPQPASSRPASRVQDSSVRSDNSTLRVPYSVSSQEAFGQTSQAASSYASLYSHDDVASSVVLPTHAEHQPSLSGTRQLMEGIPSPTEMSQGTRHEAEYLFDEDDEDDDETDDDEEHEERGKRDKYQSMISPRSEGSAKFMSYTSTISSQSSSVSPSAAGSTRSKRLPAIPMSKNNSMVSDTSSVGLAGSVGDYTQLHHSWYSSTDSLNLQGGGGLADTAEERDGLDAHAPKAAKNKSRMRPMAGSVRQRADEGGSPYAQENSESVYVGNYDTRYDIASDFQRALNISTNTCGYFDDSTADIQRSASQPAMLQNNMMAIPPQPESQQQQHLLVSQSPVMGYPAAGTYNMQMQGEFVSGVVQDGHPPPLQSAIDAHGRPYIVYQHPQQQMQQQQQQMFSQYQGPIVAPGGMVAGTNQQYLMMANGVPVHEQVQNGYYGPAQGPMLAQQQQQQHRSSSPAYYSPHSLRPVSSGGSLASGMVYSSQDAAAPNGVPMHVQADHFGRPRSYTAGAQVPSSSAGMSPTPAPGMNATQQQQPRQPASSFGNHQLVGGGNGGMAAQNHHGQSPPKLPTTPRPASFAGTSMRSASPLSSRPSARAQTPAEAAKPDRPMTPSRGPPTPTGTSTFSSAPSSTFAHRDGSMSPFPSNIGPSQSHTPTDGGTYASDPNAGVHGDSFVEDIDPQLTKALPPNVTPINYVKMTRPVFKFGGHISHPESIGWSKVDRQVAMIKSLSLKVTADVLATMHVGRPFNKPVERVRAAFVWIASNIQYDSSVPETNDEFEQQETPNIVLQRRRSRGPGFAYLFDAMMSALGIESHTIRGYLRQPLDSYQGAVLPEANHVWNAVCLDGEYRLMDTACAAKSHLLNAQSKTDSWFFLASPKELIFTHFPLAPGHQFVDPVVPLPVFWMLPYVRPNYFQSKVKLLNLPHVPRIEVKDDEVRPLVLCLRDSTLAVFAEVELHDANGSGRIVARQPLLAQCMDYKGKRMVKVLVGVRGSGARGLVKIYCGTRVPLQPRRPGEDAAPPSPGKAQKMLGFLQGKDKRTSAGDYTRIKDVDEEGNIKTVATSKTYPLACMLPIVHTGRPNAPSFVQPNAAMPNEFYIKEPTDAEFRQGESVSFHLLPVGDERLFHLQLRSPSGQQHKFVYQPSDQGYILRHTVKERGAWVIVYHTDTEGWLPIASYSCL